MQIMLDEGAFMPLHGHEYDAGYDLLAPKRIVVRAHKEVHIDFGVHLRIPRGVYGHLESKSGLNFNFQLDCPGGIIDCGFTGSIKTVIQNRGPIPHTFERGDKVVQIIFSPCLYPEFDRVDSFPETERGNGGFGSTGR